MRSAARPPMSAPTHAALRPSRLPVRRSFAPCGRLLPRRRRRCPRHRPRAVSGNLTHRDTRSGPSRGARRAPGGLSRSGPSSRPRGPRRWSSGARELDHAARASRRAVLSVTSALWSSDASMTGARSDSWSADAVKPAAASHEGTYVRISQSEAPSTNALRQGDRRRCQSCERDTSAEAAAADRRGCR